MPKQSRREMIFLITVVLEKMLAKTLSAIGTVLCILIAGLIITAPVWMIAGLAVAVGLLLGLPVSWLFTLVVAAMSIGGLLAWQYDPCGDIPPRADDIICDSCHMTPSSYRHYYE